MPTFTSTTIFQNAANICLQKMLLIMELEFALHGKEDIASIGLKLAIRDQVPATAILQTVRDMATDNYTVVCGLIGVELTDKILDA